MDFIFIAPAHVDADIRDPETNDKLHIEGEHKPRNVNWLRLLQRADVVELEPPKPEITAPIAAAPVATVPAILEKTPAKT